MLSAAGVDSLPALFISAVLTACLVALVLSCVQICRKHTGFQVVQHALFLEILAAMSDRCIECCLSCAFLTAQCLSVVRDSVVICSRKLGLARRSGYQDFDNEVYSDSVSGTRPDNGFMLPPVDSAPDVISQQPVVFEPLPHPAAVKPKPKHIRKLRPRVALADVQSAPAYSPRESTQDKLKLQSLLMNSRSHIPRNQLQYIKEQGSGWFGKVLQGEGQRILPGHRKTKVMILMLKEDASIREQLDFVMEGAPYRELDHPNVMKMLGQCVDLAPFLLVQELCPFGDLKTYLKSHKVAVNSFNEKGLLLKFVADMAAGLQAMHQQNFVHRSFGVAFWETVMFGAQPYTDLNDDHVMRLVVQERSLRLPRPDVPVSHVDRIYELMSLCWLSAPFERPSLRELRIMLLHLLSQKAHAESAAFEQKWNQLMPRRPAQVVQAGSTVPPPLANGGTHTQYEQLNASDLGPKVATPATLSFADELSESRSSENRLLTVKADVATPANEMSLEAEFAALHCAPESESSDESDGEAVVSQTESAGPQDSATESRLQAAVLSPEGESLRPIDDHTDEFFTSTPKRPEPVTSLTQDDVTKPAAGQSDVGSTLFTTALTEQTPVTYDVTEHNPGLMTAASLDLSEERTRSLMDDRKFANILQTVVMPSFDTDDFESLSGTDLNTSLSPPDHAPTFPPRDDKVTSKVIRDPLSASEEGSQQQSVTDEKPSTTEEKQ